MKKGLILLLFVGQIACNKKTTNFDLTAEAMFLKAKQMYKKENFTDAISEFTALTLRFPGSSVADSAQFFLGECHFQLDEYLLAASEYERLMNQYPQSPLADDAQFKIGMSYYKLSPKAQLDQEYTIKAIEEFQKFLEEYPEGNLAKEVQTKIFESRTKLAEKEFKNAEIYRKLNYYRAAITYYNSVIANFYDTQYAGDAFFFKGECYFEVGEWQKAQEAYTLFLQKFIDHKYRSQAQTRLKAIPAKFEKSETVSIADTTKNQIKP